MHCGVDFGVASWGVVGFVNGNCHSPVRNSQFPCRSVVLFLLMVTVWALNIAVHPALHSFPMEMREL